MQETVTIPVRLKAHPPGWSTYMAQKVTTHLVDDLTGDTIEDSKGRTMSFSFDGAHYEIDLTDDNADALREAFSDYVAAASLSRRRR